MTARTTAPRPPRRSVVSSRSLRRVGTAGFALPLAILVASTPASATSAATTASTGDVVVTNTETVQARLDATGKQQEARVYEQLTFTGQGKTHVTNPVSTKGLRNLDGFGGFTVADGALTTDVTVDGEQRLRTVSDLDHALPLGLSVVYTLDGKVVSPGSVLGKSGTLEVRYTVTNKTTRQDTVSYDDGTGTQVSTTAETVVPMIGQLVTTLPSTFTAVTSGEASIAGDGRGGTLMTFQMTLFPPIGSATAEFGYTAQITHGFVPPAKMTALPVSPLTSTSFKGGSASYASGAQAGVDLTAGAITIDSSVLKLRDGAATLLDGLVQLRDGAGQLSAGLNDEAAPGAAQLAAGLTTAHSGAARLAGGASTLAGGLLRLRDGATQLSTGLSATAVPGAAQLAAGLTTAHTGASALAGGAKQVDTGAQQLAAGSAQLDDGLKSAGSKVPALLAGLTQVDGGLAKIDAGLAQLQGSEGLAKMSAGIGSKTTAGTLLYGIDQLRTQIAAAVTGLTNLQGAAGAATSYVGNGSDLRATATDVTAAAADPAMSSATKDSLLAIAAALGTRATGLDNAATYLAAVNGGLTSLKSQIDPAANTALLTMGCGLSSVSYVGVCDPAKPGLLEGLSSAIAAIGSPVTSPTDPKAATLRGGLSLARGGVGQISAGGQTLVDGLGQLSSGASALRTGAGTLVGGTGQLVAGSAQLSGGTAQLETGAGALASGLRTATAGSTTLTEGLATAAGGAPALADGAAQLSGGTALLATGAGSLASGLRTAASGSTTLADGLTTAADGAPALVDGAGQLSAEGTSVLVSNGKETAADYGVKYAVIAAGAQRATDEGMAYGAPSGAAGATAYSIEIAGVDGAGAGNVGRGFASIALFGIGSVVATLVRRRFA
ncbi:hypothetical protein DDP54_03210 [Cellulomonas sp. WB94]|uniref:beta strand repeat-containing protein n=1 Tax=Cellulomonas sp. WB94 TaxID=2173174 RepID=UPI000D586107|nr:hypothetical protein [Cellulomonas sp. WB94]PVU82178.1 hypothetical protein DDP54_03210 [Cellulomonas sp. WB94]